MTSSVTREDVEAAAWQAGVKDPRQMDRLMRIVNLYAFTLARSMTGAESGLPPIAYAKPDGRRKYLCRTCNERFTIDFFPAAKQFDPAISVDCLACGGAEPPPRLYRCTGACHQAKPLEEFPERKRQNPALRTPCSYCDNRRITVDDAR